MARESEKKKGFKLYNSYQQQFEKLSDAAAGQLIKAIFCYVNDQPVPPIDDTGADMAFSFICSQLDRDREAYDQKCETNRKNGGLGGRPTKNQTVSEKPNGSEENQTVTESEEPAPEKKHSPLVDRFEEFWSEYPKKVGKKAALNSWLRIRPDAELFEKIMAAVAAARESDQWKKESGRFIPNPATWLNQGRWDDEINPAAKSATQTEARRDPTKNPWAQ